MLQYLVILLDDTSTSYCHYNNNKIVTNTMPLDVLKKGIKFAMMENLMIQFVFPDFELSKDYKSAIESIDHCKIVSALSSDKKIVDDADVIVINGWKGIDKLTFDSEIAYVLRTTKSELFDNFHCISDVLLNVD